VDVSCDELARRLGEAGLTILDVRTQPEFTGEGGYECDPRRGHIPGARNVDVQQLLAMSPQEIRDALGLPEGTEVIAYCHGGGRSALAVATLRDAGYAARNYSGSWHEWSRDESLPIESGPAG
jgi:thiosulfate/3-mercaptopyruvate sulfurtransferase